ncbi:Inner membrane protein YbaL [bacterium HR11]|nr:Inner membrane protein YbaL [bacterium HR11]
MEIFIRNLLIVMACVLPLLWLMERIRFPTLVAFLVTGVLIGPAGLGWIRQAPEIHALAEVGIIALLFVLGVEFSVESLAAFGARLPIFGTLQVLLTGLLGGGGFALLGWPLRSALVVGFAVSTTSTAILLKVLQERKELDTHHGRWAVGTCLFQDMATPLILLALPLSQTGWPTLTGLGSILLRGVVIVAGTFGMTRHGMPWMMERIARMGASPDFIRAFVLVWALAIIGAVYALGWPIAIGAFLAGLILSETPISHQVVAELLPLRDFLMGLFFLTLGMQLDLRLFRTDAGSVTTLAVGLLLAKGLAFGGAAAAVRLPLRTALTLTLGMPYASEFSVLVLNTALGLGILTRDLHTVALAGVFLSLVVAPFLTYLAPVVAAGWVVRMTRAVPVDVVRDPTRPPGAPERRDHVVIIGYGINGENLATVLRAVQIPYCVIEMDLGRAQTAARAGHPVIVGDALYAHVLRQAGVETARMVVIAMADRLAAIRILRQVRQMNPTVHVIVRVRFVRDVEPVLKAGADEAIPEEFETSVEIFSRVLRAFHVPRNVIQLQANLIRQDHYGLLRGIPVTESSVRRIRSILTASVTDLYQVLEDSPAVGQSLGTLNLRGRGGATVLAVARGEQVFLNPGADFVLQPGDTLVLVGTHTELDRTTALLEGRDDG